MVLSEIRDVMGESVLTNANPCSAHPTPCHRPVTFLTADWGLIATTTAIGQVITFTISTADTITIVGFMDYGHCRIKLVHTGFVLANLIIEYAEDQKENVSNYFQLQFSFDLAIHCFVSRTLITLNPRLRLALFRWSVRIDWSADRSHEFHRFQKLEDARLSAHNHRIA